MIFVKYENGANDSFDLFDDGCDTLDSLNKAAHQIVQLTAIEESLSLILNLFCNIPRTYYSEEKITWFGDHAKFIVANISMIER